MSSKVAPLIVFGITFVVGGLYWAVWDGSRYLLDNILVEDVYYTWMYWGWRMIPAVLLIVGIMCLISAGINSRTQVVEY